MQDMQQKIQELEEENRKLKQVLTDKERHYRMVAHEMKTPLAAIIQLLDAVEMCLPESTPDQARQLVIRSRTRAGSALKQVKDLLEYFNLNQSSQIADDARMMVPAAHLPRLIEAHQAMASKRNVTILCNFSDANRRIPVGETEFSLIVNNLLSNAIRYSKRDGAHYRVWVNAVGSPDRFVLSISDEGIGISVRDQEKLFSEFYRSSEAKEMTISGSGLGMAIVRKIIDEVGASIECRSEVGTGTTFTVTFPVLP
jgi:signal transduction histidine kinase